MPLLGVFTNNLPVKRRGKGGFGGILRKSYLLRINITYAQDGYIEGKPALAYWQLGEKTETIIILHGGPAAQYEYLRPEFDELSDVAKIIYYDQRGCGKSEDADSYVWQEQVKDLKRVIETFSRGKKVILVGSSWGSLLAIIYAYTHPEDLKGFILARTVWWPGEGVNVRDYKPSTNRDMVPYIERRKSADQRLIPVQTGDTISGPQFIAVHKEYEIRWGPGQFEPIHSFVTAPVLDSLRKIIVPILIFNAARENCTYDWGERYGKIFPKAELFPIQGACHSPWFTHPVEFFEKSKKFVSTLDKQK